MTRNKEEIIHILAAKYNLPIKKVAEIINYQFKYVNKVIAEGKFKSVRLPYFGRFSVKPKRLKYIQDKNK
jgi:nucleoid DNA-binding protein